jgi:hypothetical protein
VRSKSSVHIYRKLLASAERHSPGMLFNNLEEVVKIYQLELVHCEDVLVVTGGL